MAGSNGGPSVDTSADDYEMLVRTYEQDQARETSRMLG